MTSNFDQWGGFTPTPDALVKEYGFATAYVWGVVWRYNQMDDGVCKASHKTIAERVGMSTRSLIEHLNKLVEGGYIKDLTPDIKHRPHEYTTKPGEEKLGGMQILHTSEDKGMQKMPISEGEGMQNLHSRYAKNADPGMQNLQSKRVFKETESRDIESESESNRVARAPAEKKPTERPAVIPAVQVFVEVTGRYSLNKTQVKVLSEQIGDRPESLEKWRKVITAWQLCDYKTSNISGMLDWFIHGIPQHKNGASPPPDKSPPPAVKKPDIDLDKLKLLQQGAI